MCGDTTAVRTSYTLRHFQLAVAAFLAAMLGGTVAFILVLQESFLDALYRATITISLTGLDTLPEGTDGKITTIAPSAGLPRSSRTTPVTLPGRFVIVTTTPEMS